MWKKLPLFIGAVLICADVAAGQSAQRFSVQGSALSENVYGDAFQWTENGKLPAGFGGELQLRVNTASPFSIGAGVQGTWHSWDDDEGDQWKLRMVGAFLEPRYILPGGNSVVPYLSARLALTSLKLEIPCCEISGDATGKTINGGGGFLIKLTSRLNLDVGATFGYTSFGDFEFNNSPGTGFATGSGTNLIGRVGLAFGLGN
jgi:hypothetical protein